MQRNIPSSLENFENTSEIDTKFNVCTIHIFRLKFCVRIHDENANRTSTMSKWISTRRKLEMGVRRVHRDRAKKKKCSQCYRTNIFFRLLCLAPYLLISWNLFIYVLPSCRFLCCSPMSWEQHTNLSMTQGKMMRFLLVCRSSSSIFPIRRLSLFGCVCGRERMNVRMWVRLFCSHSSSFCKKRKWKHLKNNTSIKVSMVMFMHTL